MLQIIFLINLVDNVFPKVCFAVGLLAETMLWGKKVAWGPFPWSDTFRKYYIIYLILMINISH